MATPADICNKKRIVAAASALVILALVSFALKSHMSYTAQLEHQLLSHKSKANSSCGKHEMKVLSECQRCPREELRNEEPFCMETGFKQWVECGDGRRVYNWCDMTPAVEERQFWMFELCAALLAALSYSVVYMRQRKNDQHMMEKINRQMGLSA